MKSRLLLLLAMIVLMLTMSGCTSSFDSNVPNSTGPSPIFVAYRTNNTTVSIMFVDANGAGQVKGLQVVSPPIGSPIIIDPNVSVPPGKEIKVSDPNLAGSVNLTVTTLVNGTSRIVLNGTV